MSLILILLTMSNIQTAEFDINEPVHVKIMIRNGRFIVNVLDMHGISHEWCVPVSSLATTTSNLSSVQELIGSK
jgi:hypothetical protein